MTSPAWVPIMVPLIRMNGKSLPAYSTTVWVARALHAELDDLSDDAGAVSRPVFEVPAPVFSVSELRRVLFWD